MQTRQAAAVNNRNLREQAVVRPPRRRRMANLGDVMNRLAQLDNAHKSKNLEPNPFYGSAAEDAGDFLARFELYSELNNLAADKKLLTFFLLCRGLAKVWLDGLADADKQTYQALRARFREKFVDNQQRWLKTQELDARVQSDGESAETYISDVLLKGSRLHLTPRELRQCLIRGLKPELKSYVISHNPETLEQVIERINLGEAVGKISHKKESVNSLDSDRLAAVLTAAVNQIDSKLDAWKRERDGTGTTAIRGANYQSGRPQPVQEDRGQHMTGSYKPTGVVCWNCQRTGHMARDCRIPQPGRMNNNGNGRVGFRGWRPGNNNGPNDYRLAGRMGWQPNGTGGRYGNHGGAGMQQRGNFQRRY